MRRHVSFTAALLLLLALSLSFAHDGAAEVDTYGEDGYGQEATNTVGLEYDDDYDSAVGEDAVKFQFCARVRYSFGRHCVLRTRGIS